MFQQKHPHVIFEARTKANKGCANTGHLKWRNVRRLLPPASEIVEEPHPNGAGRYKRDVREATKYIETAIFVDKAMFEKRNGSTRAQVIHDAIQVANIADLVSFDKMLFSDSSSSSSDSSSSSSDSSSSDIQIHHRPLLI